MSPFARDGSLPNKLWSESSDAFPIFEAVDVDLVFDLSPSVKCHSLVRTGGKARAHLSCTQPRDGP